MGWPDWEKVLGLAVSHPELIGALVYIGIFLLGIAGAAASLAWFLRGVFDKGEIRNLESLVRLLDRQLEEAKRRIAQATEEGMKARQQIQTHKSQEEIVATLTDSLGSLQNATASAVAAQNIIVTWGEVRRGR